MTPLEKGAIIWLILSAALISQEWLKPDREHKRMKLRFILVVGIWLVISLIILAFWDVYLTRL